VIRPDYGPTGSGAPVLAAILGVVLLAALITVALVAFIEVIP
jgi:hypothetical protein